MAAKKKKKHPGGRPTLYNAQIVEKICEYIRKGMTLRQIGKQPGMIDTSTIMDWIARYPEFAEQYARAKEVQAEVFGEEIIEIADDSRNDWIEREGKDGQPFVALNDEAIQRARLRVDARKWLMAKFAPKKYGDRMAVTGKDDGPIQHEHGLAAEILDAVIGSETGIERSRKLNET